MMSSRWTWTCLWCAWAAAAMPVARAEAQIGAGALTGIVSDPTGAAVPGATVTATADANGQLRRTVADPSGQFVMPALVPGVYTVRVESEGFRPLVRRGVRVATGETSTLDLALAVGGVSEVMTVTAGASPIRAHASGLGHVVDNETIVALPLNGRAFITLAALVPGVALPPNSLLPRVNGGRPRTNEYLFDGISVLQPEPGQVPFFPNIDAVQEFRLDTNSPPAEFGRFNGGVVNLTTKSGTNVLHGTGFEFLRNESLNARNAFASTAAATPKFRRHQFGGVLGGPIRRDRTFFFADYQGQRQTVGRTLISTVPTRLQRQGIFSEPVGGRVPMVYDPATTVGTFRRQFPGNEIPPNRFDPVALALLQRYPLPTDGGTANNYTRVDDEMQDQDQVGFRLDHQMANGDHVFGRLTRFVERFIPARPLPDGSGVTTGTLGPQETTAWSFASAYRRVLSPHVLNELRAGDTRRVVSRSAVTLAEPASGSLGLPGIPSSAHFPTTLPTFVIAGYQQLGSPPNTASTTGTSVTEVADSLSWTKGRHALKLGADLRWERLDVLQPSSPTGTFTFSSLFTDLPGTPDTGTPLASFLLGQVQQFSIDLQKDEIRNRAHVEEYFLQDDWRVTDRASVNAGLRYTLNFPSTEVDDEAAVFNLQTQELDYLGRDGRPRSARRLHATNFGPRLGVVERLSERTTVRAGYGLVWIEMTGITTPFTTPAFPFVQTVTERTLDNLVPAFVLEKGPSVSPIPLTPTAGLGQGVFAVDRDLGSGYVQQWNVSLQVELTSSLSVEIAYRGSRLTRAGIPDSNLNQLSVEQLALGQALLQRVPNPYFGVIPRSSSLGDATIPVAQLLKPYPQYTTVSLYRNNVGTTAYRGVSAKVERRLSGGLSYLVAYTRSRLVDDASSVFDASILSGPVANAPVADSFNRGLERDYSTGDIPHTFVTSATWAVPVGKTWRVPPVIDVFLRDWTLTGIVTLQSGTPVAVTQATNHNAFAGFGTQRPNLTRNPALPASQRSVSRWFDTSAFSTAPSFTIGSASRNPVRGPGYRNVDLAAIRRARLGNGHTLEIRVEAFNLTNTPALGAPNGTFGSAAFGTITTAGDPRVIQLAVKYVF
ncbi:MAG: TonB-dependent receptor [Vicinamibacterales bacterium]